MTVYIIPTSSAEHIGTRLKDKGANVVSIERNRDGKNVFPDGEVYARIGNLEALSGQRVIVLHSGSPEPNKGLMELFCVLRILNEPIKSENLGGKKFSYLAVGKPSSVEVFFLYFPYGMQDKIFQTGEANMAEQLFDLLSNYYRVKRIYAVDLHCEDAEWLKKYPFVHVSSEAELLCAMKKDGLTQFIRIAPDLGSQIRLGIKGFEKTRKNSFEVDMVAEHKIDVKDRIVVVWDDIIETGGTMLQAEEKLRKLGAKEIVAAATHGVIPSGLKKISDAYSKLYLTNTINTPYANVDISEMVLEAILEPEEKK